MMSLVMRTLFIALLALPVLQAAQAAEPVSFSLQIRPLLSEKCFFCHGPDEKHREAKLRLDDETSAKATRKGVRAITPGDSAHSDVWTRLITTDEDDVMPPPKTHRTLTQEQKQLIKTWIDQGATWGKHWAFEPLQRIVPGSIDSLVAVELQKHHLSPAPRADLATLARRLALDLTGLPPTPAQAEALTPATLDGFVDSLLNSPRFGEHWARLWLDLARYADTRGYEKDLGRDIWLYRDWVINALNKDMPLDQFTIEQLAGDLLPNPTQDQQIATAFHRNTMTNDEGGTDNEEFRVAAVKDRVDTTMQVWMGLTIGCAKCHSHKYDPITQVDYYRFFALFNQSEDADLPTDAPLLSLPTPEQAVARDKAQAALKEVQQKLAAARKNDPKASKSNQPAPEDSPEIAAIKKQLLAATDKSKAVNAEITSVPVMRDLGDKQRRITKVHNRGNFLDQTEVVAPAVLSQLVPQPQDAPLNRLGMARWLVSQDNPVTPRVMANRIWARLFGLGLVETEEDFGSQGMLPSNPALLDWLALHYRDDCHWSLKKLLKTIVMSDTYQRSSLMGAAATTDPRNIWLARGPRYRLTAEMVRDQALAVSGLLSAKIGGKSVMPPQPEGLWKSTYSTAKWLTAPGEDRYRRGLYTFWKRTTPYPSMITFDAGSREVCQIRRIHTNTPLQALVTMNDPVYLEAAAALAGRMISAGKDDRAKAAHGLRLALIRPAKAAEIDAVMEACQAAREEFKANAGAAKAFLKDANAKVPAGVSEEDYAAWAVAASVILNLDEVVTRQ